MLHTGFNVKNKIIGINMLISEDNRAEIVKQTKNSMKFKFQNILKETWRKNHYMANTLQKLTKRK